MNEVLGLIYRCLADEVSVADITSLLIVVMRVTDRKAMSYLRTLKRWGIIDYKSPYPQDLSKYLEIVCAKAIAGVPFTDVVEYISNEREIDFENAKMLVNVLVRFEIAKFNKYDQDRIITYAYIKGIPADKRLRQIFDEAMAKQKTMSVSEQKFINGIKPCIIPLKVIKVDEHSVPMGEKSVRPIAIKKI